MEATEKMERNSKGQFVKGHIASQNQRNAVRDRLLKNNPHAFKKGCKVNLGRILTDKEKEILSNAHKGLPSGMKGKHQTEEAKAKNREARLHRIFPIKDTKIEIKVQELLKSLNIKFEKHKAILGQPDLFIEPNICIFVDGCYWHNCEQCFDKNKFDEKERAKIVSDQFITQKLINDRYIVLRFWEHEINDNIEKVKKTILETLKIGKVSKVSNVVSPF